LGSQLSGLLLYIQPQRDSAKVFDDSVWPALAAQAWLSRWRCRPDVSVLPQDFSVSTVRIDVPAALTRYSVSEQSFSATRT